MRGRQARLCYAAFPSCLLGWRVLMLLAILLAGTTPTGADERPVESGDILRLVYHVDSADPGEFSAVLRYLKEHVVGDGPEGLDARVVLHGDGVHLLEAGSIDTATAVEVDTLRLQGVEFLVSRRSLEARGLERSDLHDVLRDEVVSSGLTELFRLQREGFSYIKP